MAHRTQNRYSQSFFCRGPRQQYRRRPDLPQIGVRHQRQNLLLRLVLSQQSHMSISEQRSLARPRPCPKQKA